MCLMALESTSSSFLAKKFLDIVSKRSPGILWHVLIYYVLLQFMLVSTWILSDYCTTKYIARFRLQITQSFMKGLYNYPYTFFQNQLLGSISSKINDVFQLLPSIIFTIINPFIYLILLTIISLCLLFSVAPIFALSMIIWVILFVGITLILMRRGIFLNQKYTEAKAQILGFVADYFGEIINVKLFSNKNYEQHRFLNLQKPFVKVAESANFYHMWLFAFLGILKALYVLGSIAALIVGYKKGLFTPGDFALVMKTNSALLLTLYRFSLSLKDFIANWGAVKQAVALLEAEPLSSDKADAKELQVNYGHISFEKVRFGYKDGKLLFRDKSIYIKAGQKVGLIGLSGGGKSTFVHLILRLYDVIDGSIYIDGQNIQNVTQDSLRTNVSMISQDPSLFHRTLMENIRYGHTNATDQEVVEAAKQAHAHEFIEALPQGYHTLIGERGLKLSGGQRQRIAIARAILKNAPILILDEATNQLDSLTESLILETIRKLMPNKTTIVIAHRLSTLFHMDRILVFDKGKIVEDSPPHIFINQSSLYKSFWNAQVLLKS